ncbi:P1 family peptidase [uncultured Desulfovibrio sp.]|uniref:P1 family peptidase n=1 Tax=uncultured Desulfovibrio sp. TaxID=167968 RepID=UPI002613488C|nr:P1 family peptidase [uncultured Desulfovibrio sp.]
MLHEIAVSDISGFCIGHAGDCKGVTGCTVILAEGDMAAGVDVRGGGPASREAELLSPLASCERIHAVLLGGGSAFGLRAADGVMQFLEERGRGFDTGFARVPLVCASCLYDLEIGDPAARPDAGMAYQACLDAAGRRAVSGCTGAGVGCTVGKLNGVSTMMKAGLGCYAVQAGELRIGAVVAVNALGDIFDMDSGRRLAGMLTPGLDGFADSEAALFRTCETRAGNLFTGNTTIGAVMTNAAFGKAQLSKIAAMAQNGLARTIRPVHTTADGDTIYALSAGGMRANLDAVGTLAAYVMGKAVNRAVTSATFLVGCPAARDLRFAR